MKPLEGKHIIGFIYGTELYGSERGNLAALQSMQRSGAQITVGVSSRIDGGGDVGKAARSMGFNILEVPYGGPLSGHSMRNMKTYRKRQYKRLRSVSRDLLPILHAINPTHILIGSPLAHAYLAIALFKLGKPIIYRMGDAPGTESWVQTILWNALAYRSCTIVAISRFVKGLVTKENWFYSRKSTVIHNIAPARSQPISTSQIEELKQSKRNTQLVYVGQLTERKGVHELVTALIELNDPELGCWLIGGPAGEEERHQELIKKVQNSLTQTDIQFTGFMLDPRPYYQAADWHIAPSIYAEPCGNVHLEAKAAGTASLVSSKGGLPEAIIHGEDGLIIEPNASAIEAALQNLKILESTALGRKAKQSNETTFSSLLFDQKWTQVILETP